MARYNWRFFSYDEIARDLDWLVQNPDITAIILDVNSPGGMVSGVEAAEQAIKKAASAKPLVAMIDGIGASAAYWLASAAPEIVITPTSLTGSVGALISYIELEGILTRLGARKVEVLAEQSPNKRLDPDSEQGRAELQAIVDDAGEMFLQTLATNREASRESILDNYGQGLVFPAAQALKRGMVDRVESLEELVAQMAARGPINSVTGGAATAEQTEGMTNMAKSNPSGSGLQASNRVSSSETLKRVISTPPKF